MRHTNCALAMMMVAVSALCIGQQSAPVTPAEPVDVSATPVRDTHSNKADLKVPLCPAKFKDGMETNEIATPGPGVTAPKLVHSVAAELTDDVRKATRAAGKAGYVSTSIVSLVVDEHGNPEDLCLRRTSGYGLDANAAKAVRQYSFTPGTKNGEPVPIRIAIEVNFDFYSPNQ